MQIQSAQNIDELRQLDIDIATKVLGVKVVTLNQKGGWRIDHQVELTGNYDVDSKYNHVIRSDWGIEGYRLMNFSTNREHAMKLIDWLAEQGKAIILQNDVHETNKVWYVTNAALDGDIGLGYHLMSRGWQNGQDVDAEEETLPLAICNFLLEAYDSGFLGDH